MRLALALSLSSSAVAAAAEPACGPHQHVVVVRDEDEGGTMKRCACDEGWDADGADPPCREKARDKGGKRKKH
jgi:hypothetical protein